LVPSGNNKGYWIFEFNYRDIASSAKF
jgi:hypothetical protein